MSLSGFSGVAFIFALSLLFTWLYAVLLLLIPGRTAMRLLGVILIILASSSAYFVDNFGIGIDLDMFRNVAQTDSTEAFGLFNVRLLAYILVFGFAPSWILWKIKFQPISFRRYALQRIVFIWLGAIFVLLAILPQSGKFATFVREQKSVRYMMNPGNLMYAAWNYARHEVRPLDTALTDIDGNTHRVITTSSSKPLLIFLVIGETARAADFQLMGHSRQTNPQLSAINDLYRFTDMKSCGTSTAVSLPCIFSGSGRDEFDVAKERSRTNLLDTLSKNGVAVEWRDNNSGCKGICARVQTVAMQPAMAPSLCGQDYCHDEVLLAGLSESITKKSTDQLLVLHNIGSHGPAYWRRYPASFEIFKPTCRTTDLGACSLDEIHNAYDNTILYTDHVLSQMINMLRDLSDRYDTAFLYVSDHGESLGENGLFLHGAPYFFAPDVQKNIPLLLWMSEGYRNRMSVDSDCVKSLQTKAFSHDNIYHTVLGMTEIENAVYTPKLDMLKQCRRL